MSCVPNITDFPLWLVLLNLFYLCFYDYWSLLDYRTAGWCSLNVFSYHVWRCGEPITSQEKAPFAGQKYTANWPSPITPSAPSFTLSSLLQLHMMSFLTAMAWMEGTGFSLPLPNHHHHHSVHLPQISNRSSVVSTLSICFPLQPDTNLYLRFCYIGHHMTDLKGLKTYFSFQLNFKFIVPHQNTLCVCPWCLYWSNIFISLLRKHLPKQYFEYFTSRTVNVHVC